MNSESPIHQTNCPMCGHRNEFQPDEVQQETTTEYQFEDDQQPTLLADCQECGEQLRWESGPKNKSSRGETALAFLFLVGLVAVFLAAFWTMVV
jgi:hypothetical protein